MTQKTKYTAITQLEMDPIKELPPPKVSCKSENQVEQEVRSLRSKLSHRQRVLNSLKAQLQSIEQDHVYQSMEELKEGEQLQLMKSSLLQREVTLAKFRRQAEELAVKNDNPGKIMVLECLLQDAEHRLASIRFGMQELVQLQSRTPQSEDREKRIEECKSKVQHNQDMITDTRRRLFMLAQRSAGSVMGEKHASHSSVRET